MWSFLGIAIGHNVNQMCDLRLGLNARISIVSEWTLVPRSCLCRYAESNRMLMHNVFL